MPAFPTACYTETDPFPAKIDAAHDAAVAELDKQKEINAKIQEAHQSIDPMEMASRMQQDQVNLQQYAIMNTPAASWRSTVEQESAIKYMNAARELFRLRDDNSICTANGCQR